MQDTTSENRFIDFKQLVAGYPLGESHARKLIFERKIPHKRIGRKIIFDRVEIDDWIKKHSAKVSED